MEEEGEGRWRRRGGGKLMQLILLYILFFKEELLMKGVVPHRMYPGSRSSYIASSLFIQFTKGICTKGNKRAVHVVLFFHPHLNIFLGRQLPI